jgi:hypothetical protein
MAEQKYIYPSPNDYYFSVNDFSRYCFAENFVWLIKFVVVKLLHGCALSLSDS